MAFGSRELLHCALLLGGGEALSRNVKNGAVKSRMTAP